MKRLIRLFLSVALAALSASLTAHAADLVPLRLQLKWVDQAQFAGYYAALDQGYYRAQGLDVTLLPGGPDIAPEQVVESGGAEFGIDWLPSLLSFRESGQNLTNIAQIYARSGMREVSFKAKRITSLADLKGKKVGVWLHGNEYELYAALVKNHLDPENADDVEIVSQPFDMRLLLDGDVDAAAAMTYNEYAQVLEAQNPATGRLYQPGDLNVIDFNQEGTAMLQDGLFASGDWLDRPGHTNVATKFLAASFQGWAFCRDHVDACVQSTLARGAALPKGHQTWQMNEINKLIWPNALGIGLMDTAAYQQTVQIALNYHVISQEPDQGAYRRDLAQAALKLLGETFDALGKNYQPLTVILTEGGQ